jgi:hypothetical protein
MAKTKQSASQPSEVLLAALRRQQDDARRRHNEAVKELSRRTGASIQAAHAALIATNDDSEAAAVRLAGDAAEAQAIEAVRIIGAYRKRGKGVTRAQATAALKVVSAYVRERAKRLTKSRQ